MKKLIIITIVAVGLLRPTVVQAQYVEKVGASIYIDVQDMPAQSWTTASLNYVHAENTFTNTLYKRFEVANDDGPVTNSWDEAKASCSRRGAGWRVPTQKEMQLLWIMKDLLVQMGIGPFVNVLYWSSTIASDASAYAWYVRMDYGFTSTSNKVGQLPTRCIREV